MHDFDQPFAHHGTGAIPESVKFLMAAVCEVCGKGPSWGMTVSHSHRRTKRRWNPNIQKVRAVVGKSPIRLNVCTGCIKSGKVTKVSKTVKAAKVS